MHVCVSWIWLIVFQCGGLQGVDAGSSVEWATVCLINPEFHRIEHARAASREVIRHNIKFYFASCSILSPLPWFYTCKSASSVSTFLTRHFRSQSHKETREISEWSASACGYKSRKSLLCQSTLHGISQLLVNSSHLLHSLTTAFFRQILMNSNVCKASWCVQLKRA